MACNGWADGTSSMGRKVSQGGNCCGGSRGRPQSETAGLPANRCMSRRIAKIAIMCFIERESRERAPAAYSCVTRCGTTT